ncbi:carboxyl transferase domain-containing protein [Kineosporia sp. NBRC 101731]|uniref:carboxyl transferase domain-containing protein n=1 Tax=Kineosporia sp. NBRC 101731 TaxID=3032199 RepID=UPI0024A0A5FA|nr:carboxyl transferase domain-containing protein [Kineosporia sp. NBRC 101731]GLY27031.1 acetyl-CoA carboxylase [Kineosporia sp. NBRC 101731]
MNARDLIQLTLDPGTWRSWDAPADHERYGPVDEAYAQALAAARERSGLDESIVTGEGRLGGRPVALVVGDFSFLGGSIGVATAERFVAAADRARERRLPLIASPASGGTRMQEGTVAFLQMVKISAVVAAHRAAGLPYLVYLRNPTMGGVLASWGMLGHVCAAEPGALIGFLGPRVFEALNGEPFPADVQTAENLFRHGLIDAVVEPAALRAIAIDALDVLTSSPVVGPAAPSTTPSTTVVADLPDRPAWESITASRDPQRPGVRELLEVAAGPVVPLNGTGQGEADPGMLLALARFGDTGCVVLGHDRRAATGSPIGPAGLREARRGMRLAAELGLPLVSIVDTAGAALSPEAEEGGLAGEIARSLADLTTLTAPTVCLVLGQGAGGMALALLPADRVIAAEHGWISPLPPEGASEILHRTPTRAAQIADAQGVRARDLLRDRIVDIVVPEYPDDTAEAFLRRIGAALERELHTVLGADPAQRLSTRLARYRGIGL